MSLQTILTDIYQQRGDLDPDGIEVDAREESHPLHNRLNWDDTEAARRYRVGQIAKMIRECDITIEVHTPKERSVVVHAFVNVPDARRYAPIGVAIREPETVEAVREQMRRELDYLKTKYKAHESLFADVMQQVFDIAV